MIIGINGKIGSGKDTVGKIIQCLANHPDITNRDILWMIENDIVKENSKFKIKKFAGKLKEIASLLTGIPIEMFENQEFKKTNLEKNWDVKSEYRDRRPPKPMTVREFLQKLGTDALRDRLHTNVWVNALFADYKGVATGAIIGEKISLTSSSYYSEYPEVLYPNWIITDMRFPNEMEAVKERKGITIRVTRDNGTRAIDVNPHESETALDDATFDYEIANDGTIEDLIEKVKEILIKEKVYDI
jgi:hypothetical protein